MSSRAARAAGHAAAVLLLSALMGIGGVAVHARLVRAEPSPGSSVKTPPRVVRAWFSDELDPGWSAISVWDRRERRVDDSTGGVDLDDLDRRTMLGRLRPIGPGTYTVRWRAVSADDRYVAQGSFRFTVAP